MPPKSTDVRIDGRLVRDAGAVNAFLRERLPRYDRGDFGLVVEAEPGRLRMRLVTDERHLRPGGIVSGPTLMMLGDVSAYALIAATYDNAEMAVTTALTIHFLEPVDPGPIEAEASFLKFGGRAAVAEVRLTAPASASLVAQVTVSYALPRSQAA